MSPGRKVAVVTGSNKGIGLSIVKKLCQQYEGDVFLTARDVGRGEAAVAHLESEFNVKAKFHQLDIDDEASIISLKEHIATNYGGLDVLVNNAAIAYKNSSTVPFEEQAENTIKTNVRSTRRVCEILFPILKPHARVVNVSSSAGMLVRVPSKDLRNQLYSKTLTTEKLNQIADEYINDVRSDQHHANGWPATAYSTSKVLLTALTMIQQRDFDNDHREDLAVNAVHPGFVDTDMTSHLGRLTPDEGAMAPTHLALLPNGAEAPRGQMFWRDCRQVDWLNDNLTS